MLPQLMQESEFININFNIDMIKKLIERFKNLTPTAQGLIILGIILVIGIIFRWEYIVSEIARGFNFFEGK